MATDVDICNGALSLLGARAQVTCIEPPDSSAEAGYCARFFPMARKELIEGGAWAFAKRRVALAEVDNASNIWQYAYAIPSNMVNALRVVQQRYLIAAGLAWPLVYEPQGLTNWTLVDEMFNERGSAQFTIENGVLYTNEPDAVLLYTVDVTDATKFPAMFCTTLSMLLASYLCGPILKGVTGMQAAKGWRDAAMGMQARAEASDANSTDQRAEHVAAHLRARW